jgi:3-methyladenine DNA glycosylase/8-oxoguanine DNA glycosylase
MAAIVERAGPVRIRPPRDPDHFLDLAQIVVYQQLHGRAAAAIWGRVAALFDGRPSPEAFLALPEEALRGAGLSASKVASLKDLAARVASGALPLRDVGELPDEEVVSRLSAARGIGRWTAEMFLIFHLRRLDVWPVTDYGVRHGWAVIHGLGELPTPKALAPDGDRFRPYRTVAAWYCWRAVDVQLPQTPG